jgi:hypothetical protein
MGYGLEVASAILSSLGGAAIIVGGLAHFLGRVWSDRLAQQTQAKYAKELETLKTDSERFLAQAQLVHESFLAERNAFGKISQSAYQKFFDRRISTYELLVKWKSDYIKNLHEDFLTEELDRGADVYYSCYRSLRKLIIENQLYVSNELAKKFEQFRIHGARYLVEADREEAYALGSNASEMDADQMRTPHHEEFARATFDEMKILIAQIDMDVERLRSRVEIDGT